MRWVHALGAAVAATALVGTTAQAVLSLNLVQVNANSQAGTIGGGKPVRTYDLVVTQTGTEKFNVGNLQTTLASSAGLSGYFYASPGHDDAKAINPNITGNANPQDPFDTFVSTPQFDDTPTAGAISTNLAVTGSADWPVGPGSQVATVPTKAGNNVAGQNQAVNIVWGDPQAAINTTTAKAYVVAQLTVVGNTGGFIRGYFGENANQNANYFNPNNATGALATSLNALNGGLGGAVYLPILGDLDKDGIVGLSDINLVKANAGTANPLADVDADGIVGLSDINFVKANAGNTISAPLAGGALGSLVPEPTSLTVIGLGLAAMATRRRRQA